MCGGASVMPFDEKPEEPAGPSVEELMDNFQKELDKANAETERLRKEMGDKVEADRVIADKAVAAEDEGKKGAEVLDELSMEDRKTARGRQKQKAITAVGRRDTILTGPLGQVGETSGLRRKTLLGE